MSSQYDYWVYQQENPDEQPPRTGWRKKHTPLWVERLKSLDQLRKEIGDDKFYQKEQEYQEWLKRYNNENV
jgi:hypothetical protein